MICGLYVSDKPGLCGKITIVSITKSRCTISWSPPEDDGGAPINNYVIEKCEADDKVLVILDSN